MFLEKSRALSIIRKLYNRTNDHGDSKNEFGWVMKVLTVIMMTEMVKPVIKVMIRVSVKMMIILIVGLTF